MKSDEIIKWLAFSRRFYQRPKKFFKEQKAGDLFISTEEYQKAKNEWDQLKKENIFVIPWGSETYPKSLTKIYDPPLVLFGRGEWQDWEAKRWVAVVGARKATRFGLDQTRRIVAELVDAGFGIVSGLAFGIDAAAHKASVTSGGATWGVLGSGIDRLYPQYHTALSQQMSVKGGVLSEFPLGVGPFASHFPQRNRIISGLSEAVVVVQASIKSGALITAEFALEQGKEIFVAQPPNKDVSYEGNWKLIEEGAVVYEGPQQVLGSTGPASRLRSVSPEGPLGPPARLSPVLPKTSLEHSRSNHFLISLLDQPKSLDTLVQKTQKRIDQILTELILLESEGLVQKRPGGLWQNL